MVDGVGRNKERCLKWGGEGSLRNLSHNSLKRGWVKEQIVLREGNQEVGTAPAFIKMLIVHQACEYWWTEHRSIRCYETYAKFR